MGATTEAAVRRRFPSLASSVREADEDLIAGVRAGDDAAFERIYDRYARGLFAFCVHMLKSRETAEDALQQTFVAAYRAMQSGTNDIVLRPWLYTIARNRCLSEIRARREVEPLASDPPLLADLSDQVQRREDLREMLEEIQRLPDDQRAALVLFELGDNSHKEIAAIIGVPPSKVKALVFQAREGLSRGRLARDHPCAEIRERIAAMRGVVLPRSVTRAHIDRCRGCAAFEAETRSQRAALALIVPVPLAVGLKSTVLGAVLHGGAVAAGASAAGASAGAGGATAAGASVAGGGAVAAGTGATIGGGATVAGGVAATGGLAGVASGAAGTAAVAGGSVAAVSGGLTVVGVGVGGLGATGVMAKMLTTAAVAFGAAHVAAPVPAQSPTPLSARQFLAGTLLPASPPPLTGPRSGTTVDQTETSTGSGPTSSQLPLAGGQPPVATGSRGGQTPTVSGITLRTGPTKTTVAFGGGSAPVAPAPVGPAPVVPTGGGGSAPVATAPVLPAPVVSAPVAPAPGPGAGAGGTESAPTAPAGGGDAPAPSSPTDDPTAPTSAPTDATSTPSSVGTTGDDPAPSSAGSGSDTPPTDSSAPSGSDQSTTATAPAAPTDGTPGATSSDPGASSGTTGDAVAVDLSPSTGGSASVT